MKSPIFSRDIAKSAAIFACSAFTAYLLLVMSVESVHGQVFQDGMGAIEVTDQNGITPGSSTERNMRRTSREKVRRDFKPEVGRQAAAKYMAPQRPDNRDQNENESSSEAESRGRSPAGTTDRYLALHFGSYLSDNAYRWGVPENQENVGRWNAGVTYRIGEWVNSMDLLMRFDVSSFTMAEGGVTKFSFLPIITFPDASSRFPLYFGAGLGLGIFGTQLKSESSLALDYQLLAGARFFNLWDMTGLFVEGGIKNHLHIFSDGQFNGTYITTGLLFTF